MTEKGIRIGERKWQGEREKSSNTAYGKTEVIAGNKSSGGNRTRETEGISSQTSVTTWTREPCTWPQRYSDGLKLKCVPYEGHGDRGKYPSPAESTLEWIQLTPSWWFLQSPLPGVLSLDIHMPGP